MNNKKRIAIKRDGHIVTNFCLNTYEPLTPATISQYIKEYQQKFNEIPEIRTIDEVLNKIEEDIDSFLEKLAEDKRNIVQRDQQVANSEKDIKQKLKTAYEEAKKELDDYFKQLNNEADGMIQEQKKIWFNQRDNLNLQIKEIEAFNVRIKRSLNGTDEQLLKEDLYCFLYGVKEFNRQNQFNLTQENQHEKNQNFLNQISKQIEIQPLDVIKERSNLDELRLLLSRFIKISQLPLNEFQARNRVEQHQEIQRNILGPYQNIIYHPNFMNQQPPFIYENKNEIFGNPHPQFIFQNQQIPPPIIFNNQQPIKNIQYIPNFNNFGAP